MIRDALALPEKERAEVVNRVAKELAAGGPVAPEVDVAIQMANAIEAFNRVAEHLGYDNDIEKLLMLMREFDAAPARVREGVKARHIARVFKSWALAKEAAIGEQLETTPAQQKQRMLVSKEKRRSRRIEEGLEEWLATGPERTSMSQYNKWREKRNASLQEHEPKFLAATSVITFWKRPWPDIVADAEAGTLKPPVRTGDPYAAERSSQTEAEDAASLDFEPAAPDDVEYDPALIARRLREARTARGLTMAQLATSSTVSEPTIERLEEGSQGDRIFLNTVVRLAKALEVPTDFFVTSDGKTGLPARPRAVYAKRRLKRRPRRG